MVRRSYVFAAVVAVMAGAAQGQQIAPGGPPLQQRDPVTTIRAHARAVLIDVVVTDGKGHAVHGLKPEDFHIVEDGHDQRIASFEEVKALTAAERAQLAQPVKLPVNTYSNANAVQAPGAMTVLLLDGLDTPLIAQSYARSELLSYLEKAQPGGGPIAIFALDMQLHLVQGFTTDLDRLRTAVKERDKLIQTVLPRAGFVAQQFRYDALTHGMDDLGKYLANFPGRKNLIWFTASVPYADEDGTGVGDVLHDSQNFAFDYKNMTDVLTLGRVSVYPIDAEGLRTNPAFSAAQKGPPSIGQITAFSVSQGEKHVDLERVAQATGGHAFYNTNGIRQAISQVVETGSNYYTLTYYPTNKFWHGEFRKLKVQVDEPETHLEYRRGYFATTDTPPMPPSPNAQPSQTATNSPRRMLTDHTPNAFAQAMQLGAVDPGTIVFSASIKAPDVVDRIAKGAPMPAENYLEPKFRDKPFRQYEVKYQVSGKDVQLTPAANGTLSGKVEFVAVVLDDKGNLVNSEQAEVVMNVRPETYDYMLANGFTMPVRIAVPAKGNYFLRTGVHDEISGKAGALEVAVGEIKVGPLP